MSVPGIVQTRLNGEQIAAEVSLGSEDTLYVTPTRVLIYRADGLLSDEEVEEYNHGAERIEVEEGRRKATVTLDRGIDGTDTFKIPTKHLKEALHPVLAGALNAAGVTEPNETITQTYLFSELTLVVTSERVVKHVGAAVWDEDFDEFPYSDVTALEVEEGSVSSQIILKTNGRPERVKTPSDRTSDVRGRIERALLAYHDVGSYAEFERLVGDDEDDERERATEDRTADTSEDVPTVDPLGSTTDDRRDRGADIGGATVAETSAEAEESDGFGDSGFQPASSNMRDDDTAEQLEALTQAVEQQNELLAEQQRTLERLVKSLTRDR